MGVVYCIGSMLIIDNVILNNHRVKNKHFSVLEKEVVYDYFSFLVALNNLFGSTTRDLLTNQAKLSCDLFIQRKTDTN